MANPYITIGCPDNQEYLVAKEQNTGYVPVIETGKAKIVLQADKGVIAHWSDGTVENLRLFTALSDVPNSYSGSGGHYVRVKSGEDGLEFVPAPVGATDELVKVSTNDTTADYLGNKLVAGTGVTLTVLNAGANEQIEISASGGGGGGHTLVASVDVSADTSSILVNGLNLVPDKEYEIILDATLSPSSALSVAEIRGKVNGSYANSSYSRLQFYGSTTYVSSGSSLFLWGYATNQSGIYSLTRGRLRIVGDRTVWHARCRTDTSGTANSYNEIITSIDNTAISSITSLEFYLLFGDAFASGTKLRIYEVV